MSDDIRIRLLTVQGSTDGPYVARPAEVEDEFDPRGTYLFTRHTTERIISDVCRSHPWLSAGLASDGTLTFAWGDIGQWKAGTKAITQDDHDGYALEGLWPWAEWTSLSTQFVAPDAYARGALEHDETSATPLMSPTLAEYYALGREEALRVTRKFDILTDHQLLPGRVLPAALPGTRIDASRHHRVTDVLTADAYVIQRRGTHHWVLPGHDLNATLTRTETAGMLNRLYELGGLAVPNDSSFSRDEAGIIYGSDGQRIVRFTPTHLIPGHSADHCPGCRTPYAVNGEGGCPARPAAVHRARREAEAEHNPTPEPPRRA